ncbi:MAG: tRNA (N6-isopentenyl adenosine(37)-C2)-methylthiotransferase MiaB [Candidatus Aminicenantes bacterium]|nr:tRNA (N6-isopentenyl adenosine(37)-C2)-methylthiotransferase MiaB [Candidatus Aminicenantes bacterium]
MNENDSERIAGSLIDGGAIPSDKIEDSDIIIVNTCAVRQKSEEKLFSLLGRLRKMKQERPLTVGVVGCVAQLYRSQLFEKNPVIDFVLGPDNYWQIQNVLTSPSGEKIVATAWNQTWHDVAFDKIRRESDSSAFVTIMEGCNNFCTYCVVPYTRGREKYRPASHILEEVRHLAQKNYAEIQLLGQNVNSYHDPVSGSTFDCLLQKVNDIDGIQWIRFLTSHPKDLSDNIARTMKESSKVCRQIHLPLQSGSSSILKKMNRGYTKEEYLDRIAMIRQYMPDVAFSTDVIVGFPGEEEKDFQDSLAVLELVRFVNIFSFRYSPRPGTSAAHMKDSVAFDTKKRRLIELQALQKKIQMENNTKLIGKNVAVLLTGRSKKDPRVYSGRNEAFQVVNFEAEAELKDRFVQVTITSCGPYSLRGKACKDPAALS